jgi:glutamate carboxypeptidase
MQKHQAILDWIGGRREEMLRELIEWVNINTGTGNVAGIDRFLERVVDYAGDLGGVFGYVETLPVKKVDGKGNIVEFSLGKGLWMGRRAQAPRRVLLCIHSDTVYPADGPFQKAEMIGDGKLRGPGVADAKGGLMVMLTALHAFERSPLAETIGWEVLINPDEEIGSPAYAKALEDAAKRNHVGLLFEPALSDGGLAGRRKGSGNFSIIVRGKSAHTGRDFAAGRNAVLAAAELTVALHQLNETIPGAIVNVGAIEGGGPANMVPDLAVCRVNARTSEVEDEAKILRGIEEAVGRIKKRAGIGAEIVGGFSSAPKNPTPAGWALLDAVVQCGRELGIEMSCRDVGGACDGNRLAAAGLPNVDTLGVRGGGMHSSGEFMEIDSLVERARLTCLLLLKLAGGELPWPEIRNQKPE